MAAGQDKIEKAKSPAPEALAKDVDYIIRHASEKKISKEEREILEKLRSSEHFAPAPEKGEKGFFKRVKDMFHG